MKTIIVPTDFSPSSYNAALYAADLAYDIKAALHLLNVIPIPISVSEVPMPEPVLEDMIKFANEDLDKLKEEIEKRTFRKVNVTTELVTGNVAHQIDKVADGRDAFCIVMGLAKGQTFQRLIAGSNTISILKGSKIPLWVIPENAVFEGINKVGFAVDLNEATDLPFDAIGSSLEPLHPSLHMVYVGKRKRDFESAEPVYASAKLQNSLPYFKPQFHFIEDANLSKGIDQFIRDEKPDLLLVVPKKHSPWDVFEKSGAKDIVLHHDIPTLSIHA